MLDIGLTATGLAAAASIFGRRRSRWLMHLLLLTWVVAVMQELGDVRMSVRVMTSALFGLSVALAALVIVTVDPTRRDARIVGGISIAIMPTHWLMSVSEGAANWTLYAIICNAAFVLQCFIVGGWLDGLGRSLSRFFARLSSLPLFRLWRN